MAESRQLVLEAINRKKGTKVACSPEVGGEDAEPSRQYPRPVAQWSQASLGLPSTRAQRDERKLPEAAEVQIRERPSESLLSDVELAHRVPDNPKLPDEWADIKQREPTICMSPMSAMISTLPVRFPSRLSLEPKYRLRWIARLETACLSCRQ